MKINLGYSISLPIKDYIINVPKEMNSLQIMFTKNKLNDSEIRQIKSITKDIKNIYVHASYQINMGTGVVFGFNPGFEILINEINYSNMINAKGIILHTGKNVKKQYDSNIVYNNMVQFIIDLFINLKKNKTIINLLIETPAGQGGEMCYDLNEFVNFIMLFKITNFYDQIGICIDTCHIFQAGYDLNDEKVITKVHKIFEPVKDKIKLIHLNDSYNSYGKHLDRHEQLGKGNIKVKNLLKFIYWTEKTYSSSFYIKYT